MKIIRPYLALLGLVLHESRLLGSLDRTTRFAMAIDVWMSCERLIWSSDSRDVVVDVRFQNAGCATSTGANLI